MTRFTFQYGSNQIDDVFTMLPPHNLFTFQYGSNQINHSRLEEKLELNLHSNMVLIK